jgi:hypothetical protein
LRRAEIKQRHAPTCRQVQVVREVGIGLHDAKLEQLAKQQALEKGSDGITSALRRIVEQVERHTVHEIHRQDPGRRQVPVHTRNEQRGLVGNQSRVAFQEASLAEVIGFQRKLALGLGRQTPDVEVER